MNKPNIEDIKDILGQMHYTAIKQLSECEYEALNPFNEYRKFLLMGKGKKFTLISKRDLTLAISQGKNFQQFTGSFTDDEKGYKLDVVDYVINKSIEGFAPEGVKKEVTDLFYR